LITGGRFDRRSSFAELFRSHQEDFATLPVALMTPRYDHISMTLDSGDVLIAGGWGALTSAELYDARAKQFKPLPTLPKPMANARALKLDSGNVLLTGGWRGDAGTFSGLDHSTYA